MVEQIAFTTTRLLSCRTSQRKRCFTLELLWNRCCSIFAINLIEPQRWYSRRFPESGRQLSPFSRRPPSTQARLSFLPDVLKGDLDSARDDVVEFYKANGTEVIRDSDQVCEAPIPLNGESSRCIAYFSAGALRMPSAQSWSIQTSLRLAFPEIVTRLLLRREPCAPRNFGARGRTRRTFIRRSRTCALAWTTCEGPRAHLRSLW